MSLATDIREVSETAMEQFADRFDDLPRPLLAVIGAGDLAVEQLAVLRASLLEQFADTAKTQQVATEYVVTSARGDRKAQHAATNYVGKVQQAVTDLPEMARRLVTDLGMTPASAADLQLRAEQVAAAVAESIQNLATQIPEMVQGLVAELPDKVAEFTGDVSVDTVRDTVEAYTELVGTIYGSLADRGDRRWSRVRSSSLKPGTVVDAVADAPKGAATGEPSVIARRTPRTSATRKTATPKTTRSRPTSTRTPRAPAESGSTDPS